VVDVSRDITEVNDDPIFRHTRREAWFIMILWTACLIYNCTYCYLYGYLSHPPHPVSTGPSIGEMVGPLTSFDRDPATLTTPLGLGIPDWVFYGVVMPWLFCIVATFWFCLFIFVEDDLSSADASPENSE